MASAAESLAQIEEAIRVLLVDSSGIQSYTVAMPDGGSRTFNRINARDLFEERDRLRLQASRESAAGSGGAINYGIRGNL